MVTDAERKKKAEELNNSNDLYARKLGDYPEVKSALQGIFEGMKAAGLTNKKYTKIS